MAKKDIFDKTRKTGEDIINRKLAKAREMEQISEAVTTAAAEMERAALDGNEADYARAKEKHTAAENRLEILQIRTRNNIGQEDYSGEIKTALDELKAASLGELRKLGCRFLEQYAEILETINAALEYDTQYNNMQEYYKTYVIKDPNYNYQFLSEFFPVIHIKDFKQKFTYQLSCIKKALNKD